MNATVEEIKEAIRNSTKTTSVYVGCDSKVAGRGKNKYVKFATVVILHIDSKHGGKLFSIIENEPLHQFKNFKSPKHRLMNEAYKAIGIACSVAEVVEDRPFEVHLDFNINAEHKSNTCVKEATGYVLGTLGFEPKYKPNAFAASTAGDRLVN